MSVLLFLQNHLFRCPVCVVEDTTAELALLKDGNVVCSKHQKAAELVRRMLDRLHLLAEGLKSHRKTCTRCFLPESVCPGTCSQGRDRLIVGLIYALPRCEFWPQIEASCGWPEREPKRELSSAYLTGIVAGNSKGVSPLWSALNQYVREIVRFGEPDPVPFSDELMQSLNWNTSDDIQADETYELWIAQKGAKGTGDGKGRSSIPSSPPAQSSKKKQRLP
ncbi:hypothetical protein TWF173_002063 [Orbilia oligospora]|nr:hypothetical protein TWF173_002063 [Orbilia oligospora]